VNGTEGHPVNVYRGPTRDSPWSASESRARFNKQNLGDMISGMSSPPLDLDEAFADFNFCGSWDPTLSVGPNQLQLLQMICQAREGDRGAAAEFADSMYWTLRKAAFESFLRKRGERAIFYGEWFYEKIAQLTSILLHDGGEILKDGKACWIEARRPWDERLSVLAAGDLFFSPTNWNEFSCRRTTSASSGTTWWSGFQQKRPRIAKERSVRGLRSKERG